MGWDESFLHDAGLKSIDVDWAQRTATLRLTPHENYPNQPTAIRIRGLRQLVAQRLDPWGPSESIMTSEGPDASDEGTRLVLHMQSGDEVTVIADTFHTDC
jgi:hypothetical protein